MCRFQAAAFIAASGLSHNDLHFYVLESDLIVDQVEQSERTVVGQVIRAQLDPRRFAGKLGMRTNHFTVQKERNVRIEFFLELMKPLIRSIPWSRLVHRENDFTGSLVHAKQVDHRRIGEAHDNRLAVMDVIGLLILRH